MSNITIQELYNSISRKLLDDSFLNKFSLNRDFVKNHIESNHFFLELSKIVSKRDYSCIGTLNLCKNILTDLCIEQVPNNWLEYLYEFCLSKSFPHAVNITLNPKLHRASYIYLEVLRIISQFQKKSNDNTWQSKYPLNFLSKKEMKSLEDSSEYMKFIKSFNRQYVYELMKLNQEVKGFSTIDHICGVHYLAMYIGKQVHNSCLSIDLGRVSGSTAGHDIGKFGCTSQEQKRVPYLHYYYTDLWFNKNNIEYIRNIAANHSVWDLELENLSIESLILIYCDFRVKNVSTPEGYKMTITCLSDAFDVILNKLDNMDEEKQKRYTKVYNKLKDFENFLLDLGISVDVNENISHRKKDKTYYSLLQGKEIVDNVKYLSIYHNVEVMHLLRTETSLDLILQSARSEKNGQTIREYLSVFEEYSTYLTQNQKLITLKFLYELLIHPDDDIRKHSSEIIGKLIAIYDTEYRKELPKNASICMDNITSKELLNKYIQLFLYPSHKIIPKHQEWIGELLNTMISSFFENHKKKSSKILNLNTADYIYTLIRFYNKEIHDSNRLFYLIDTIKHIPFTRKDSYYESFFYFLIDICDSQEVFLRISGLNSLIYIINSDPIEGIFIEKVEKLIMDYPYKNNSIVEDYLLVKINKKLNINKEYDSLELSQSDLSSISLKNLKSATNPIIKKVQIEILLENALTSREHEKFKVALHYCNLLKVSSHNHVRREAGLAILKLIHHLSYENRNEIVVELVGALELTGYQFSKYIPNYLGEIILTLRPNELDDFIKEFSLKIKTSNDNISSLLLKTIGVAVANYSIYRNEFSQDDTCHSKRLMNMLGLLLNGLVHYSPKVEQMALGVIGRSIFASNKIDLEEKNSIFKLIAKKILNLVRKDKNNSLLFLSNGASLHHIYKFISDYIFTKGDYCLTLPEKIAFFPGTFDPFSLSHKKIVTSVRDLGFEVYLAIDEFSWSKQTLPHKLRKNIINMSIASELDIYTYPKELPTNIANDENLKVLRDNFPYSHVNIVVGSDVIINASAYNKENTKDSIQSFPHIVFDRNNLLSKKESSKKLKTISDKLSSPCTVLTLSAPFEEISSTQIRNYIDENRDISSLIDPLAQRYIYENGFYRSEPQFKSPTEKLSFKVQIVENFDIDSINELSSLFRDHYEDSRSKLVDFCNKPSARILILRDLNRNGQILGFSIHHWTRLNSLYNDLKNIKVSEYVRENSSGRILILDGIFTNMGKNGRELEQIILTETLSFCISKDYEYAVYNNMLPKYHSNTLQEILSLQGFLKLDFSNESNAVYVTSMNSPTTLYLDIETVMKEPFKSNIHVQKAIIESRKKIQNALTKLYPGNLVLSFNRQILHERLIRKICAQNNVPTIPFVPKKLGKAMCVSFGNMLNRSIIPNTVTKSMHTEKMFFPHMDDFKIGPFPHYTDLDTQVKMIKSFNRPVILIDDILHKGYRNNVIHPLLQKHEVNVEKTIVGLLSARGKELIDRQGRHVDCAYYIPKLRAWFNESYLLPFFGGDTLWRGETPRRNLIPSVNLLLPYTSPTYIAKASNESIYNLSKTCIQASINILTSIENEYHNINERKLTLESLGEVFIAPRCPDQGRGMHYDLNLNPSHYLLNDLERLSRLKQILIEK
ncbi:MAG: cytidyltransferase [Anaeromicrobium sp.]|jgi:nicotinic acid mononucleotide adenylyltransferase|uniref:cytidyltransferase n=1 Tax=Anaeromicrobium sp. TaxID=1929132 RepID=UPI0025E2F35A|nr:cytidyltransferase [Anaeromicrobium sp.]MCT4596088.1 cytidyltransferase [Anaeromicrobium sp.]